MLIKRFDKDGNLLDNNPNNSNIFYEIMRNNDPVEKISARGIVKKCYETEIKFPCAKVDQLNTIQCFFNSTTIDSTNNFKINLLGSETIVVTTTPQLSCRVTIDGGDVLYKCDADGDSPLVANYDGPASSKVNNYF